MLVNRKSLLDKLVYLGVAVAAKNNNLQMDCVVFDGRSFHTFNDDIAVSVPVPELKGAPKFAVKFKEFQAFIAKWPREECEFEVTDTHVTISSKRATARLAREAEILMPYSEWADGHANVELGSDFSEGLAMVAPVCSKDSTRPMMTCVWMQGRNLMATDGMSLARFKLEHKDLPPAPIFLPAAAAMVVGKFSVLAYGTNANGQWTYFLVGDKKHDAVISCRTPTFGEESTDTLDTMLGLLKEKGVEFELPARLEEILDRASVILQQQAIDVLGLLVRVELEAGRMTISTTSQIGDYTEHQRVDYDGEYLEFYANAEFLSKAIKDRQRLMVCEKLIHVYGKNFDYLVARNYVDETEVEVSNNTEGDEANVPF